MEIVKCPRCEKDVAISRQMRDALNKEPEAKKVKGGYIVYVPKAQVDCPNCGGSFDLE